ncbi:F-box/FBD/LRR-repeat protein At1g13570 [Spinacia oleracea]|uniref:F-box/FBD/LRR-repeat protein At1g13570 n=1 Tax=Spinacia oleracea TaxID=3562 RepID=A0ABM3R8P1_SPIOL|nr:F-box/FBD/LRR-repeat protein At1g13570-like [Spinacia oleracea]
MSSSKSPKNPKALEANPDLISNLPPIATDKILKNLPLEMAARMSVLSTKWNENWLSLRHLLFDKEFWERQGYKYLITYDTYHIVSNILFHHNGPLHQLPVGSVVIEAELGRKDLVFDPRNNNWEGTGTYPLRTRPESGLALRVNRMVHQKKTMALYKSFISIFQKLFLSRTCVKKIALLNWKGPVLITPYHIFKCEELVKLRLVRFVMNPPPRDFKGFANLRSLKLVDVECNPDIFGSLIASCPRLRNVYWIGSYCYRYKRKNPKGNALVLDSLKDLATSCQLQYLHFGGRLFEFLARGGVKSLPGILFYHLNKLSLTELNYGHVVVYFFVHGMVRRCPFIKDLEISLTPTTKVLKYKVAIDDNYKLDHLIKVKFTGISGSWAELEIIEYLLAISGALEYFYFKCENLDAASELKVSRHLMRFQRASTKAQLVCLE